MSVLFQSTFEHLVEERNSKCRGGFLLWSKDPRIKLGVFLHPCITKFSVDCKGNEMMLMPPDDPGGERSCNCNLYVIK